MKQAQNARQQRGRPSSRQGGKSNRGPGNHRNEQQSRGNPKQLVEKYKNQARECLQAGDRMQAEYYFQFAEHYYRVLNETRNNAPTQGDRDSQQQNNRQQNNNRNQGQNTDSSDEDDRQGDRQQRRGRRGRSHGDQQNAASSEAKTDAAQSNGVDGAVSDNAAPNNEAAKPEVQPVDKSVSQAADDKAKNGKPAEKHVAKEVDSGPSKDSPAQLELNDASPKPKPVRRRAPRKTSASVEKTAAAAPLDPATSDLT